MAVFASAFLRTGRAAFARSSASNPIQQALGVKGATRYAQAYRNYATAFERSKPHVNIGMRTAQSSAIRDEEGAHAISQAQSVTSTTARSVHTRPFLPSCHADVQLTRPPSPQQSPSARRRRATPTSSNMPPLTKPPKSASAASPSPPPTSSTKPTTATTRTSTAPATPITSRT